MLGEYLDNVRNKKPLIHCINNFVTINDVANIVLACGGSPIMANEPDEAAEITSICGGLDINIGMLNKSSIEAMLVAGRKARELGHMVLLDPVGLGASRLRRETVSRILSEAKPDVIRGNISEIKTLAAGSGFTSGVDANVADKVTNENLASVIGFVKEYARSSGAVIAVSGAIDLVSNGETCYVIRNGRSEMSRITGTGCQLSGMMTAFLTANPENKLEAAAAVVCTMGLAGEIGWSYMQPGDGNSTYRNRIIDAVYNMDAQTLNKGAKIEIY